MSTPVVKESFTTADLAIVPPPQASPIVLLKGDVVARIDDISATAEVMSVTDAESAQAAADFMRRATALGKEIESARTEANAPALALQRAINAAVKEPAAKLDAAKRTLQRKVGEWQAEQDRKRRETEVLRLKELARIEAEKRKAEDEQRRREEEAREANLPPPPPMPAPVAPVAQEVVLPAVPLVAQKIAGVRMRSTLTFEIVDASQLPEALTVRLPDNAKIRAQFCALWRDGDPIPEVPGLRFTVDRKAVSA